MLFNQKYLTKLWEIAGASFSPQKVVFNPAYSFAPFRLTDTSKRQELSITLGTPLIPFDDIDPNGVEIELSQWAKLYVRTRRNAFSEWSSWTEE